MSKNNFSLLTQKLNDAQVFFCYLILFELAEITSALSSAFLLLVVAFNLWLSVTDKTKRDVVLFSTFLIGSEAFALLNLFVYIFFSRYKLLNLLKTEKTVLIMIGVVLGISAVCAVFQGTIWNFVGYTAYLCILVAAGITMKDSISPRRLTDLITRFVWIELVVMATIFLRLRSLEYVDAYYGTLRNSHTFANWLIMALAVLLCNEYARMKRTPMKVLKIHGLTIGAILIMLMLTEAKMLWVCACLGLLVFFAFYKIRQNKILKFILLLYAAAFLILPLIQTELVKNLAYAVSPDMASYIYDPDYNGKFVYVHGTFFESLKGFRLFTGYGLGQYGSRVANAFAYDVMWRGDNFINNFVAAVFESSYVPEYARYISYYTEEFVSTIWWRSAILSYPFNSFTALIGETGLIGLVIFAYIADKFFRNSKNQYIVFYLMLACVFDTFLDNILCIGPALLFLLNAKGLESKPH